MNILLKIETPVKETSIVVSLTGKSLVEKVKKMVSTGKIEEAMKLVSIKGLVKQYINPNTTQALGTDLILTGRASALT